MTTLLTINDIKNILHKTSLKTFFNELIDELSQDFKCWNNFHLTPRHATHYTHGVIELMPISDPDYYTFKYVNGHPNNPQYNKMTVMATGQLSDTLTGFPLMICDMTLATALRTAATSALAARHLANTNAECLGIIGTGAQAEFQVLAQHYSTNISTVYYYDIAPAAMKKFNQNLQSFNLNLIPCKSIQAVATQADILTTATAAKKHGNLLNDITLKPGVLLNAIGGDCPGKTEINLNQINYAKIVVELLEQTKVEGDIQQLSDLSHVLELWEIILGQKPSRENTDEIIIFDSVGCAIEDFSTIKLLYRLANKLNIGQKINLIPEISDPKNLFCCLQE